MHAIPKQINIVFNFGTKNTIFLRLKIYMFIIINIDVIKKHISTNGTDTLLRYLAPIHHRMIWKTTYRFVILAKCLKKKTPPPPPPTGGKKQLPMEGTVSRYFLHQVFFFNNLPPDPANFIRTIYI